MSHCMRVLRQSTAGCHCRHNALVSSMLRHERRCGIARRHLSSASNVDGGVWLWLSSSSVVTTVQSALTHVHDHTGLPWWASIAASTVMVRVCVALPLQVYQHYVMARYANLKPHFDKFAEQVKLEVAIAKRALNWDEHRCRYMFNTTIKRHMSEMIVQNNCHPAKGVAITFLQLPVWVSMSMALRNLTMAWPLADDVAVLNQLNLSVGGALWFPNLLAPDPLMLLPLITACVNLCSLEIGVMSRLKPLVGFSKVPVYLGRSLCCFVLAVSSFIPSALVLYWSVSSSCSLATNLALMSPKVRRLLRIPRTQYESVTPYRRLWRALLCRLKKQPPPTP